MTDRQNIEQRRRSKGNKEEGIRTRRQNGGKKRRMERSGTKWEEEKRVVVSTV